MINWSEIARSLHAVEDDGECGSSTMARAAIEQVIGEKSLRDAVDFYISREPGFELVRHVLWLLHPWSAMLRCYEIYKAGGPLEDRIAAVELLRVVADSRALRWIPEFLEDPEPGIQNWGIGVVDQLLWGSETDEKDCAEILAHARNHSSAYVREQADRIDQFLKSREE